MYWAIADGGQLNEKKEWLSRRKYCRLFPPSGFWILGKESTDKILDKCIEINCIQFDFFEDILLGGKGACDLIPAHRQGLFHKRHHQLLVIGLFTENNPPNERRTV
jgi:hypothetical protein